MNRLHGWADRAVTALIVALFNVFARIVNHTQKEPW